MPMLPTALFIFDTSNEPVLSGSDFLNMGISAKRLVGMHVLLLLALFAVSGHAQWTDLSGEQLFDKIESAKTGDPLLVGK